MAVKRIKEIMAGVDGNSNPTQTNPGTSQLQKMSSPSPVATPAFNQPSAVFDRQPLPPGVSWLTLYKKIKQPKKINVLFYVCLFFLVKNFILYNYTVYLTYNNKLPHVRDFN